MKRWTFLFLESPVNLFRTIELTNHIELICVSFAVAVLPD